jgi:peroxiredoxin/outer membrane lipoprotein-sorting protein
MVPLPTRAEDSPAMAHYDQGMRLKKEKKLAEAATELEKALSLSPAHVDAHWALAWVYAGTGEKTKAVAHFRKVFELEPNSQRATEAREAVARLGSAEPAPGAETGTAPKPQPVEKLTTAEQVLEKCAAAHAGVDTLSARGTYSQNYRGLRGIERLMAVTLAYQRPNKFRVELADDTTGHALVCDGQMLTTYLPILKQYTQGAAPPALSFKGEGIQSYLVGKFLPLPMQLLASESPLDTLKQGATQAALVGEETLRLGEPATPVPTYHVRLTVDRTPGNVMGMARNVTTTDLWIDAASFMVRKYAGELDPTALRSNPRFNAWGGEGTLLVTEIYHTALVDQPVSDTLFAFAPPNDQVRLVKTFEIPGLQLAGTDLEGKKTVDFTLHAADGKTYSLRDFTGRPTVLCFWNSMQPDSRTLLPLLDKLVKEFENGRLVVLALCVEAGGGAKQLVDELKIAHPTLWDPRAEVTRQYGAFIQPTLVFLDKLGVARAVLRGPQEEQALREKLRTIGL